MHLYLTKASHINSSYVNDDGQVLYKVETPNLFFNRVATIKRILPGSIYPLPSASRSGGPLPYETVNDNDVKGDDVEYEEVPDEHVDENGDIREELNDGLWLKDRFSHLAEIKFNVTTSSILRFGGQEHKTSHFFTRRGFGFYGRHRAFTGLDGLEYRWNLGIRVPELVRLDSANLKTPIARFHRRCLGIIKKRRPASLEIFPEGIRMVDQIIITFVYIQKIRNDAEKAARRTSFDL